MTHPFSMRGLIAPVPYALLAIPIILSQHALVDLSYRLNRQPLEHDSSFWILPLGRLAELPGLGALEAALAFAIALATAWALAILSFRRAMDSDFGHRLAPFAVVPTVQILVVALLALQPSRPISASSDPRRRLQIAHQMQGVLAGIALLVLAVIVSALSFGAYGWGLFVLTPLIVGTTTAYIANRDSDLGIGRTTGLVMEAAAIGSLALIMFALEGLICLIMAVPLGAIAALIGALIGHGLALTGHRRGKPLLAVGLLPAAFALEAAMPPSVVIASEQSIEISATPAEVWTALTSDAPIAAQPGLVGEAGLAYPLQGRIVDRGPGGRRLGYFSTGVARERITRWEPGRRLAFEVLSQPPAMEEMSPYRRVEAPHLHGYFATADTSFELSPLAGNRTRLTVRSSNVLRIDPVPYWEPIARWALRQNSRRVLADVRDKAERANATAGQ